RACQRRQFRVKSGYARPFGLSSGRRLRVAGDNRRLKGVEAAGSAKLTRSPERLHAAANLELVPERTVLLQQQNRLARGIGPRGRARGVQLHQGKQSMGFG